MTHANDADAPPVDTRLVLPQVTLVAIDGTMTPAATEASLVHAASLVAFGSVLFFSPVAPSGATWRDDWHWIDIPPTSLKGYNQFCLARLHGYVATSHCLTIHSDSHIVNVSAWDDHWLEYDYVGAPWPPGHTGTEYRVGNSGFCLRSKRLLEATASLPNESYVWRGKIKPSCRDDVITCVMYRTDLERRGLTFAPVEVAARFAFENPTPEAPFLSGQFGTHEYRRKRRTT